LKCFWPCVIAQTFSNYQLNAQFLYSSAICMLHYDPQHVSSSTLLILRRTNCITTASGFVTLCKQPYSTQVESGLQKPTKIFFVGFKDYLDWWMSDIFHKKTINIVIIKNTVTTDIFHPLMWQYSGWQMAVLSLLPPWRRPHIWPKHVGGNYIIN